MDNYLYISRAFLSNSKTSVSFKLFVSTPSSSIYSNLNKQDQKTQIYQIIYFGSVDFSIDFFCEKVLKIDLSSTLQNSYFAMAYQEDMYYLSILFWLLTFSWGSFAKLSGKSRLIWCPEDICQIEVFYHVTLVLNITESCIPV